jgi:hypothetical protein
LIGIIIGIVLWADSACFLGPADAYLPEKTFGEENSAMKMREI